LTGLPEKYSSKNSPRSTILFTTTPQSVAQNNQRRVRNL
jgi:hypothetical protein